MATKKKIEAEQTRTENLVITPPNMKLVRIHIRGTTDLVQNKFSEKARQMMHDAQLGGGQKRKGGNKDAKDFHAAFEGATHKSTAGWFGIPVMNFKAAMISACRLCGFKMTLGKTALFVGKDGVESDGCQLVRITKGERLYSEMPVRNQSGVADLRARPKWEPGWEAIVPVKYDGDIFNAQDIFNLMERAGIQVGVGEGRPDSKASIGMNWGQWEVVGGEMEEAKRG